MNITRRDFLLSAAAMMLFPADAFANTVVHTERTFGVKKPEIVTESVIEEETWEVPVPRIKDTDLIIMLDDTSEREVTKKIIVHHTGNATDVDMSALEAHLLHKYDFEWAGIGYHYVIRKDGTIEKGRPEHLMGAHSYGHNKDSIGIALSGNFDLADPTEYQMRSLITLSAYLAYKYDLELDDKGTLFGHRDMNDTRCPGDSLYSRLDYVRNYA